MKKILFSIMILCVALSFGACGSANKESKSVDSKASTKQAAQNSSGNSENIDVDLTTMSSTMVYSEVYNMLVTPNEYIGKKVKMRGEFAIYEDEKTGSRYFAVIIADASACCSQGLEFVLKGEHSYPKDYPELGTEITVMGQFQTYEENGEKYSHLIDAEVK